MSERDIESVRRWVEEMWNQGDREICAELIAPTFVEHAHAPFSTTAPGEVDGPRAIRETRDWLLGQFPTSR